MAKLSIIIPAYNEENTIEKIVDKLIGTDLIKDTDKEILIINDFSTDATAGRIANLVSSNPDVAIITQNHESNKGKGAAIHTGIAMATGDILGIRSVTRCLHFYLTCLPISISPTWRLVIRCGKQRLSKILN